MDARRPLGQAGGRLAFHVGHAQASSHREFRKAEWRGKAGQHLDSPGKRSDLKNLTTDVGMQADQLHRTGGRSSLHGGGGKPAGDGETELGIVLAGGHELMGVGLYTGGDAQQHPGPDTGGCG